MKKIFLVSCLFFITLGAMPLAGQTADPTQGITGSWRGTLKLGSQKLRLVFNITENEEIYTSTMDSPDQGALGIPVESTSFEDSTLKISDGRLMMTYEGELDGDIIKGTFRQSGAVFELTLERGAAEEPARPQTPEPPYPYNSEDMTFTGGAAGVTLAGTFTSPRTGGNFPAVVLITGSGPQNRDEEVFGHKPFLVLADYLTRNGIAVLRFDDRGVGESGGDYASATIHDFAADAMAAAAWLKGRKDVDSGKIGLLGHSEGGSISFILAAAYPEDIAFIVSMAGAAADNFAKEQRRLIFTAMGRPQEFIDANEEIVNKMAAMVEKYGADNIMRDTGRYAAELAEVNLLTKMMSKTDLEAQLRGFASPEMQSMLSYDAAADLRMIKCPVLALNGEKDLQVTADMNLAAISENVDGKLLTVKKYAGLNHLFQHADTGLPTEYASIEETIAPEVLEDIAEWILRLDD